MFRKLIWRLVALLFVLAAAPASAAFNVFASVPEWAALATGSSLRLRLRGTGGVSCGL